MTDKRVHRKEHVANPLFCVRYTKVNQIYVSTKSKKKRVRKEEEQNKQEERRDMSDRKTS
jgi:hypothetical protein